MTEFESPDAQRVMKMVTDIENVRQKQPIADIISELSLEYARVTGVEAPDWGVVLGSSGEVLLTEGLGHIKLERYKHQVRILGEALAQKIEEMGAVTVPYFGSNDDAGGEEPAAAVAGGPKKMTRVDRMSTPGNGLGIPPEYASGGGDIAKTRADQSSSEQPAKKTGSAKAMKSLRGLAEFVMVMYHRLEEFAQPVFKELTDLGSLTVRELLEREGRNAGYLSGLEKSLHKLCDQHAPLVDKTTAREVVALLKQWDASMSWSEEDVMFRASYGQQGDDEKRRGCVQRQPLQYVRRLLKRLKDVQRDETAKRDAARESTVLAAVASFADGDDHSLEDDPSSTDDLSSDIDPSSGPAADLLSVVGGGEVKKTEGTQVSVGLKDELGEGDGLPKLSRLIDLSTSDEADTDQASDKLYRRDVDELKRLMDGVDQQISAQCGWVKKEAEDDARKKVSKLAETLEATLQESKRAFREDLAEVKTDLNELGKELVEAKNRIQTLETGVPASTGSQARSDTASRSSRWGWWLSVLLVTALIGGGAYGIYYASTQGGESKSKMTPLELYKSASSSTTK